MEYTLYEVGGKVRDELLDLTSNDVDYTVVVGEEWITKDPSVVFAAFVEQIKSEGYSVFLETESCQTVRAKFPEDHHYEGVADFVLARKELGYLEGTRTPIVAMGTLEDDLRRRDFTVNAMARDTNGDIIDLFGGKDSLSRKELDTPLDPDVSFSDDPLRILRAFRFAVVKDFVLVDRVYDAIEKFDATKMKCVSDERVREELRKMFKHDTLASLHVFQMLKLLNRRIYENIFSRGYWLEPTNKK